MQLRDCPTVDDDGAVVMTAGRFAREAVLSVFEQIGGVEAMAEWAANNPDDFYTKVFTKTITREIEQHDERDIDRVIAELDERMVDVTPERDDGA